ncbi:hypothetical protein VTP01DRAFT_3634 [Rhizomucor pusillus]|uniref:uncharacterized protein n=1 Tax=Rhizomucor pusillus TaxID=4840 RepID=UPI0037443EB8
MAPQSPLSDYRVVVGIDFGTTFSGAAYGFVSSDEITDITNWPKQSSIRYPKTPTMSLYNRVDKTLAMWGNAARLEKNKTPPSGDYLFLQQYKLYLDDRLDGVFQPIPGGFNPISVIADYLREFHAHILNEMKRGFAQQFEGRYRYCLTVPAMWSDRSKQAMRMAAIESGIIDKDDHPDRLMLISEPEAAAIYCEQTSDQFDMKDGDEFMICDAGGGTVDLIVFAVEQNADGRRRFKETTKGTGKSCGSTFVDRRMRKLLRSKLKRVVDNIPQQALEAMMEHFVDIMKPSFDGQDSLYLPVPMSLGLKEHTDPSIELDDGVLRFSAEDLKERVFEPVVKDVLQLLHEQRAQTHNLKAIFTVGGFGASQYLHQRILEEFGPLGIKVIAPYRPELAVARGAVLFGKNPTMVATRVPRYWYGIGITNTFVEGVDPEEYKIIKPDGSVRCDHRFSTYVRRGVPLAVDSCVTKTYSATYPHPTAFTFYAASTEDEPRRQTRRSGADGHQNVFRRDRASRGSCY